MNPVRYGWAEASKWGEVFFGLAVRSASSSSSSDGQTTETVRVRGFEQQRAEVNLEAIPGLAVREEHKAIDSIRASVCVTLCLSCRDVNYVEQLLAVGSESMFERMRRGWKSTRRKLAGFATFRTELFRGKTWADENAHAGSGVARLVKHTLLSNRWRNATKARRVLEAKRRESCPYFWGGDANPGQKEGGKSTPNDGQTVGEVPVVVNFKSTIGDMGLGLSRWRLSSPRALRRVGPDHIGAKCADSVRPQQRQRGTVPARWQLCRRASAIGSTLTACARSGRRQAEGAGVYAEVQGILGSQALVLPDRSICAGTPADVVATAHVCLVEVSGSTRLLDAVAGLCPLWFRASDPHVPAIPARRPMCEVCQPDRKTSCAPSTTRFSIRYPLEPRLLWVGVQTGRAWSTTRNAWECMDNETRREDFVIHADGASRRGRAGQIAGGRALVGATGVYEAAISSRARDAFTVRVGGLCSFAHQSPSRLVFSCDVRLPDLKTSRAEPDPLSLGEVEAGSGRLRRTPDRRWRCRAARRRGDGPPEWEYPAFKTKQREWDAERLRDVDDGWICPILRLCVLHRRRAVRAAGAGSGRAVPAITYAAHGVFAQALVRRGLLHAHDLALERCVYTMEAVQFGGRKSHIDSDSERYTRVARRIAYAYGGAPRRGDCGRGAIRNLVGAGGAYAAVIYSSMRQGGLAGCGCAYSTRGGVLCHCVASHIQAIGIFSDCRS
ncbi:hypothetical protein C8F04DRAFT_1324583 [Mycena alexandri]|uniref:Uncharacterized protein n=1 Tax=Mycena alexandri TaxID=1745969 RepID=A0AAD6WND1_9AGAR|nr:hypothetical protein C8F04DRAFT_1324583 [Mycena alexandri]